MLNLVKSLVFAFGFMIVGYTVAEFGLLDGQVSAQQAVPPAREGSASQPATDLRSSARDSAAALAPDVKLVLDQVAKRIEGLETRLVERIEKMRAVAIGYAVWVAAGLFALFFLSSVLGGTVVALLVRRSR